ncbi:MAG: Asp-tRNA(Asn)/Glu-tRNA(Gln) amidotransferase subunit GatB [Candidatus Obscuribacterales bacterium]|nr:Asp-tRNA(Asn)/Glu-tRNA(Gln) amidotransferase subunit GatB [Candidatus Obscuribacterales bacterium]
MKYDTVIGLEVHAQLKTKTKIFCSCPTEFGQGPNDQVCPICLGMPGVLPVLNKRALELAIRAGLSLNCEIAETSKFDRKNYFYPDLPKGYQISQYDKPICKQGNLTVKGKKVRITRAHLEEDAGKLVHAGAEGLHGSTHSCPDYNRAGVPLLEIVSEPDITSAEEAREYLTELRTLLRYVDVCDGNLEEGSFRCDANVSIKPAGSAELGTRTEIKNMNSFKAVERAIISEVERQKQLVESGGKVVQETRLWNEATGKTFAMRSKEDAHDYRYFPEPDLVPFTVSRDWVKEVQEAMPELPEARRSRYAEKCGLSADDAYILAENKDMSDFFDEVLNLGANAKTVANWLLGPALAFMNESSLEFTQLKATPQTIADLADVVNKGTIGTTTAKQLLPELLKDGGDVNQIIKDKGLAQVSDEAGLKTAVEEVIAKFPDQLAEFRSGKVKVRQFFFGETMKSLKGKGNPQVINKLLDELLPGQ